MPLSCRRNGRRISTDELSDYEWRQLRANYRAFGLRMACCNREAIPKESTLGTPFFAHKRRGDCESASESAEHLAAKATIAKAAREAGWEAQVEARGEAPRTSESWVADVLCTRGRAKVAFEVQLSPQTEEEYRRRQRIYSASGVRTLWLHKRRRNSHQFLRGSDQESLPLVHLDARDPAQFTVHLERDSAGIPLVTFIKGALDGALYWQETRPGRYTVEIETATTDCLSCKNEIISIPGLRFRGERIPLAKVSDWRSLQRAVAQERFKEPLLTLVELHENTTWSVQLAAMCPHCLARQHPFPRASRRGRVKSPPPIHASLNLSPSELRWQPRGWRWGPHIAAVAP